MAPLDLAGLALERLMIANQQCHDLGAYTDFIENHDLVPRVSATAQADSNRNYLRALLSLKSAWDLAGQSPDEFDYFIFLRPDLYYRDPWDAERLLKRLTLGEADLLAPAWHAWGGVNDRFAIANPKGAKAYAERISQIGTLSEADRSANAETLLASALSAKDVSTATFSARAHRVRADGRMWGEGQSLDASYLWKRAKWQVEGFLKNR